MSQPEEAIFQLLKDESSKIIPDDHGRGPSKFGITLETYKQWNKNATADSIIYMTQEQAEAFYRQWWDTYKIGLIDDQALASKVFNIGVNIGPGMAVTIFQIAINANGGYSRADGILGPLTATAANSQDPVKLLSIYKSSIAAYYRGVVQAHPEWANDLQGWLTRANA